MSEKIKGRSKHLVDGSVAEIKKNERVDDYKTNKERKSIFSRFMGIIKKENKQ